MCGCGGVRANKSERREEEEEEGEPRQDEEGIQTQARGKVTRHRSRKRKTLPPRASPRLMPMASVNGAVTANQ